MLRSVGKMVKLEDYNVVKEGMAEILFPKKDKVFYNPIQQFNRDLSVMAITAWSELEKSRKRSSSGDQKDNYVNILEALSATGLRALRYAHEVPNVGSVVANDLLADAVDVIRQNIEFNKMDAKVTPHLGDAARYMASTASKFHVVDLDPYGTAVPFIDSALACLKDDGLLLVTCTDAGVIAGSGYPEKCFSLYGGNNFGNTFIGSEANHEVGIRLILNTVAQTAAKYKKTIEPLLSLAIDYYFRLFIRVTTSPIAVKSLASSTMLTYHCIGCGSKHNQFMGRKIAHESNRNKDKFQTPRAVAPGADCEFCGSHFNVAGPMYGGKIHSDSFITRVLDINARASDEVYRTRERIRGMLTLAQNELETPFYFNLNQLSSYFKSPPISINDFCRALGSLGYSVSLTHAKKNCIKTDAPWEVVLQVNKQWMIQKNTEILHDYENGKLAQTPKTEAKVRLLQQDIENNVNLTENMIGYKIVQSLKQRPQPTIDFTKDTEQSLKVSKLRNVKMVRFQENPTKNWGPKAKPRDEHD